MIFLKYLENNVIWPFFRTINLLLTFFMNGMPPMNPASNPIAEWV
jgi:hypothetical protein